MVKKIVKSEAEWRAQLGDETYYITRQQGTERPFTGKYEGNKQDGTYHCICCGSLLFSSKEKYESGSGWPSFWKPADGAAIASHDDYSHNMHRTEVTCDKCEAHLGHVFPDGPEPTGLRFCINSASMDFKEE